MKQRRLNEKGMTLVEIMIVLVILGGMMAIFGSKMINQLRSARIKEAKIAISELGKKLEMFNADCGFYPEALEDLVEGPENCPNWAGPYAEKLKPDPWQNNFVYLKNGGSYELKSLGADRAPGGTKEDQDISSLDL